MALCFKQSKEKWKEWPVLQEKHSRGKNFQEQLLRGMQQRKFTQASQSVVPDKTELFLKKNTFQLELMKAVPSSFKRVCFVVE